MRIVRFRIGDKTGYGVLDGMQVRWRRAIGWRSALKVSAPWPTPW